MQMREGGGGGGLHDIARPVVCSDPLYIKLQQSVLWAVLVCMVFYDVGSQRNKLPEGQYFALIQYWEVMQCQTRLSAKQFSTEYAIQHVTAPVCHPPGKSLPMSL